MKMDIAFSENPQAIDVDFAEDPARWTGEFGQIQVLHNGQNGATFTPSVSPDGVISWTNDRELPNPAPVNIKPVRGVDYCTEKDIDYIVKAVLAALGGAESEDATTAELDKAILDTMILE